ncbi:MAG: alanine--tRNA ligase [Caldithrix sp.]|nr:alanine--tRNA ligase [Caldithrix sp.]
MTSKEIRQQFIDFFKNKQHTFVPSSPVVPQDDPTLLFTNAGMNQFKDVFLEKGTRSYNRAVNSQKCIRVSGKHNDLEEVGHDTYHHTFFEMLGNWSFGDYYKKEAIQFAWELLTDVWKLPKNKLYATVYTTDDEAAELWESETDIHPKNILRFGEEDNFWEMGATGPCGPCSEIHIDLGPEYDDGNHDGDCFVNSGCARYIEIWNLVFIQYYRDEDGKLHNLPKKHVDTGAGFERLVAILQNKASNYATDLFTPVIDHIQQFTQLVYGEKINQPPFHVIADHVRMLTFSIADGGLPSNDGRGYVMRRILRRAARYGRKLDILEPFIYKLVSTVIDVMGDAFPEIRERQDHIEAVIKSEEEHFNRTLDRGLEIFDKITNELKNERKIVFPGTEVFKLYDTYGFPTDLTRIMAEEEGMELDMKGFEEEMEAQRQRARAAAKFDSKFSGDLNWITLNEGSDSRFVGYEDLAIETHIMSYAVSEDYTRIVLKETPFYAESGGQIGDQGMISGDGFELQVKDTQKEGDHIIHLCKPANDFKPVSDKVVAEVVSYNRMNTAKNHTATHLLHAALRNVLGEHVTQAGSLVEPDRLRFDFTHFEKITDEQIINIESIVNQKIQQNISLEVAQQKFDEAKKRGAMALFGEKYSEVVRTIQIADFSLELCGGTHVRSTGEIGLFIITYESSIASGVRRIEAITGPRALDYAQNAKQTLQQLSHILNTGEEALVQKTNQILADKKKIEKELQRKTKQELNSNITDLLQNTETINGIDVLIHRLEEVDMDQMKELGDKIREQNKNTAALLISENAGKITLVCVVSDDLIKNKQIKAGELINEVAKVAGGGGGGRPHLATAGAKNSSKLDESIVKFKSLINSA